MRMQFTRGIRFEIAQDVLGAVIAHWAEAVAEARDAANPDAGRLAAIQAEQRKLRILRDELDPADLAQMISSETSGLLSANRINMEISFYSVG